ncbi:ABC transporter ATP-binding protein [Dysosmobacter sp.]|uniref:ABC transporter ATP-binding protein n=1 Tax=Dysosmobacter sp. TaxID=2591382 RepID=UPI002A993795|nr:ABC transporter ATP-binding protein [Dysosmobacter sp.]MCI6055311.1 ABC transporter ATP-binding protein/permease [Dysosmobacter sp.]MDY5509015.1 ABC transporter ATP-binding protein [Dysosmobacter sp.]
MKVVLGYLKPYTGRVAVGVTIKFTAAILELVLPLLLAAVIDDLVPARDLPAIWRTGALMGVLAFAAAACNITANRMAAWVSMEVTRELRRDLYRRVQALSCAQMDRFSASSMVSRLTNDTYNVHQMFDKVQRGGIRAPMLVLGGLVLTFLQQPVLALVQLAVSLLTFLTITLVTRQGIPFYTQAQQAVDTVVRILRENASGVRVIKALACQGRERERFETANHASRRAEEQAGWVMAMTNPITDFLLNTGLTLVVLVGALWVDAGRMQRGQIVAFLTYFTLIQSATLGIAKVFVRISKGAASARRIREILQAPLEQTVEPAEAEEVRPGILGMENATFSYLGVEPDLEQASFTLEKGQMLGILGPTGSGKTTLISLLLRLYDADGGVVWVGGKDVRTQERRELQTRFGVVFQGDTLIAGSVYENISFLRGLSREAVEAAARTAQAWEFIETLPQGLDTRVDLRGANLSGGQRQRLLIARALAGDPEILILDSADSALDYWTAAALRAALRRDLPGVTLVVISERVSSVREADRILVLESGRIDAQGSHRELLETCARYRQMAELQMGEGAV